MQPSNQFIKTRINGPAMQSISVTPVIQSRKYEKPSRKTVPTDDKNKKLDKGQATLLQTFPKQLNPQQVARFQDFEMREEHILKPSEIKANSFAFNENPLKIKDILSPKPVSLSFHSHSKDISHLKKISNEATYEIEKRVVGNTSLNTDTSSNKKITNTSNLKQLSGNDIQEAKSNKCCAHCKFFVQVLAHSHRRNRTSRSLDQYEIEAETGIESFLHNLSTSFVAEKRKVIMNKTKPIPIQATSPSEKATMVVNSREESILKAKKVTSPKSNLSPNSDTFAHSKKKGVIDEVNQPQSHMKRDTNPGQLNSNTLELQKKDSLLKEMERRMQEVVLELNQAKEQLDFLTKEKQNWSLSLSDRNKALQAEMNHTVELLVEKQHMIATLESEMGALQLKYEQDLANQKTVGAQIVAHQHERINELESQLLNLDSERCDLIKELQILSNSKSELERRLAESNWLLAQEQQRARSLQEESMSFAAQKDQAESKHSSLLETNESNIRNLKLEIQKLRQQLSDQSSYHQQDHAETKARHEIELNSLSQQLNELKRKQSEENGKLSQMLTIYEKEFSDQLQTQKIQAEEYKSKNEILSLEIKHLSAQNSSLIESLSSLQKRCESAENFGTQEKNNHMLTLSQLEAQNQRVDELGTLNKQKDFEIHQLALRVQVLEEKLQNHENTMKIIEDNHISFKNSLMEELKLCSMLFKLKGNPNLDIFHENELAKNFSNTPRNRPKGIG